MERSQSAAVGGLERERQAPESSDGIVEQECGGLAGYEKDWTHWQLLVPSPSHMKPR